MRVDVAEVRDPLQQQWLAQQADVAARAGELLKADPAQAAAFLTQTTRDACLRATETYWKLGDRLWEKYDEKW